MPKLLTSYRYCYFRREYTREKDMDICAYPTGSPWCKHHPGDMRGGFPFDCPLPEAKE